jgi:acetyltransferase-like isoleucine patch superfamily enzyme
MSGANIKAGLQKKLGFRSVAYGPDDKSNKVETGPATWIGDRVSFMPKSSIGEGTIVGAGSIVTKNFPLSQLLPGIQLN